MKHIILADGPRLVREMLCHALKKVYRLKGVREVTTNRELLQVLEMVEPAWVIICASFSENSHRWIQAYPAIRFIFLSPTEGDIKLKCQASHEESYSDLSLGDLIHILEKDLQRI